jgi:tetratricopeptide (TPR) repeat protein
VGELDSLAFAVSRGERWELAKMQLAGDYEQRQQFDSAAAEYAGLARDAPLVDQPWLLLARVLAQAGHTDEAEAALRKAIAINPTAPGLAALGRRAAQRRLMPEAIALFQRSLSIQPMQPDVLYQLSLSYAMAGDLTSARRSALQLAQIAPGYKGVGELLRTLGVR